MTMIEDVIDWNPWWELRRVPKELLGSTRQHYNKLLGSINIKEITIILGPRRAGKSTLMYQTIEQLFASGVLPEQVLFVNLEDKKLRNASLDELYAAYRGEINPEKKAYVFFDEIHRKVDWEAWLRKKYDLKEDAKFVISGSCAYLLKKEYATLLTGRNLTFEVLPLSFEEFLSFKGIAIDKKNVRRGILLEKTKTIILRSLKEYITLGGFPEVVLKQQSFKTIVLAQYFDDILYKDIVDRHDLNSQKVRDLALYFATNFTGIVSLRNVRNALGLSYDTIKDYISYYEDAFLFFAINHFSYSFKEQKTLPSKIYCIDNGLRNASGFTFSKDEGKLAENMVFVELKRRNISPYYWKSKWEVDFVIKNPDQSLEAINVSYTDEIAEREQKAMAEFGKEFEKVKSLTLITKNTEKKEGNISYVPLWKWLLE